MHKKMRLAVIVSRFTCVGFLCGLFGCASTASGIVEKLDPATGVTVTFVKSPLVLYRETPARAAYAREFAQLGPILVNRSGDYRYYLWVGAWATMQRSDLSEQRDSFESIVIFAGGEPILLEQDGWTPGNIGVSELPYVKPVATASDVYYSVTRDQLQLISEASDIRLHTRAAASREYGLWGDQDSVKRNLVEFLERTRLR
jgi:hypothetical protein